MAICPKCLIDIPLGVEACAQCGTTASDRAMGPSLAAPLVPSSESGAGAAQSDSRYTNPVALSAPLPSPMVEPILTPATAPTEQKPFPSHTSAFLGQDANDSFGDPMTLAATPAESARGVTPTLPLQDRPSSTTVCDANKVVRGEEPVPATISPSNQTPIPQEPPVLPKLRVLRGLRMNQEYPIYQGRNTIGRFADKPVDIDLTAQEAEGQVWSSRQHAVVTFDKGVLLIEDLNSLNGTWLNGNRIHPGQQRLIKPGDVIQIGTVQLKIVTDMV